ncbi:hypothetical protein V2J09_008155 [Rumex salicifolius]
MDPNYPNNYNPGNSKGKSISNTNRAKREPMKVKYISSPIMVQASNESEFRAVVQELTGKNSPGTHPGTTVAPDTAAATAGRGGGQGGGGGSSKPDAVVNWSNIG